MGDGSLFWTPAVRSNDSEALPVPRRSAATHGLPLTEPVPGRHPAPGPRGGATVRVCNGHRTNRFQRIGHTLATTGSIQEEPTNREQGLHAPAQFAANRGGERQRPHPGTAAVQGMSYSATPLIPWKRPEQLIQRKASGRQTWPLAWDAFAGTFTRSATGDHAPGGSHRGPRPPVRRASTPPMSLECSPYMLVCVMHCPV
jgi:hypothetical protein